jgi:uroporphyrinogen decarboxylase
MDDLVDEEPVIDESQLEIVRHVVKELGSTHYIIGRGGDGSFPETGGLDSFLMRMITEPAFVHRATEIATRHALAVNQALLDAGVDCIWAGADYCDSRGPMMSPRHFREYIQPAIRALCDHAHSRGTYLIKHTDGSTWPILDMMLEAGIDGWHGIQPQIGMDMKLLKERYGDRLVLVGGVDCHTLCAGTEEDVRRETAYALRHAGHDGGLILCSGNTLMVGVKYENYIAMLDEAGIELDPEVRKGLGKRI